MRRGIWIAAILAALFVLSGCVKGQRPTATTVPSCNDGGAFYPLKQGETVTLAHSSGITQTVRWAQWCAPTQSSCLAGEPELVVRPWTNPREAIWDGPQGLALSMVWKHEPPAGICFSGAGWSVQETPTVAPTLTLVATPDPEGKFFREGLMAVCTKDGKTQRLWIVLGTSTGNPLVGNPPLDNQGKTDAHGDRTAQEGQITISRVLHKVDDTLVPGFRVRGEGWECVEETLPSMGP